MVQKYTLYFPSLCFKKQHQSPRCDLPGLWPSVAKRDPAERSKKQAAAVVNPFVIYFFSPCLCCWNFFWFFFKWMRGTVRTPLPFPHHAVTVQLKNKMVTKGCLGLRTELALATLEEHLIHLILVYCVKWAQSVIGLSTGVHIWTEWIQLGEKSNLYLLLLRLAGVICFSSGIMTLKVSQSGDRLCTWLSIASTRGD